MSEFLKRYSSEVLTCGFILQILLAPLADRDPRIGGLLALVVLLLVVVGARHMTNRKIIHRVVLPVAGLWLVARGLEAFGDPARTYAHLAPIAGLGLSCAILWALLDRFDRIPMVTRSAISEAFISYLVIAIAFSQLYWILNRWVPNSFNQVIPEAQTSTLLYFSMITLSGVAYGGIIPVNPYIRMIAAIENMTGIFFVAVIVARLVASYRPRTHHTERDRPS